MSSSINIDDMASPIAKRQRTDWADDALDYVRNGMLRDLDIQCFLCFQLRSDCAMLRSTCKCALNCCFLCYKEFVVSSATAKRDGTAERACAATYNPLVTSDTLSSGFYSHSRRQEDVVIAGTIVRCPQCRAAPVEFFVMSGSEWMTVRRMAQYTEDVLSGRQSSCRAPEAVALSCPNPEHKHPTDYDWITNCEHAVFSVPCPAKGCASQLVVSCNRTVQQAVAHHLGIGTCTGVVECPACKTAAGDSLFADADGPDWKYEVAVPHAALHLAMHHKLVGLWLSHKDALPSMSETARANAWWASAVAMFKGAPETAGGVARFRTRTCALSRLLNAANYERKWVEPWMMGFMASMDRSCAPFSYSFANFFDAAYASSGSASPPAAAAAGPF
jgi:hypothetical protein